MKCLNLLQRTSGEVGYADWILVCLVPRFNIPKRVSGAIYLFIVREIMQDPRFGLRLIPTLQMIQRLF